tara:strand:- start:1353 stop:1994 length:642 start_codon:yes stop_codon:yes gene_type:complete
LKPIVIIPARGGSKRFPEKNKILWEFTSNFLKDNKDFFGDVFVSTDCKDLSLLVAEDGFNPVYRPKEISTDDMPVTPVIRDVVAKNNLYDRDIFMMYLTSPERNIEDYTKAYTLFKDKDLESIISFYKPEYSPYMARYEDTMEPIIKHSFYRYQDFREIILLTHYVCLFKGSSLHKLDNQLYGEGITESFLLDYIPVDIDFKEQLERWKLKKH